MVKSCPKIKYRNRIKGDELLLGKVGCHVYIAIVYIDCIQILCYTIPRPYRDNVSI